MGSTAEIMQPTNGAVAIAEASTAGGQTESRIVLGSLEMLAWQGVTATAEAFNRRLSDQQAALFAAIERQHGMVAGSLNLAPGPGQTHTLDDSQQPWVLVPIPSREDD